MTKKQAINVLKEDINLYISLRGEEDMVAVDLDSVDIEALNMAIKALEQESVLDKIREEISEHADRLRDSLYGDGMRHCIEIIDEYKTESEKERAIKCYTLKKILSRKANHFMMYMLLFT